MKSLKRCREAMVYDDAGNLLCKAGVFLKKEENLMISVPGDFDGEAQEQFEMIFVDLVKGLLPCKCSLSDPQHISGGRRAFQCQVHEQGEWIQRRNDIKVPVHVDILMHSDGARGGKVNIVDGRFPGTVMDISAGGTYIVSHVRVGEGSEIEFVFPETKTPVTLKVEVLRVVEFIDEEGNLAHGHGCRFIDLSRNEEAQIRNYVFQIERQMYKKDIW